MLRLDRFAALYVVAPWRRCTSASDAAIPVLMYHSVSDAPETHIAPYFQTRTSPAVLGSHLQWLRENGYRSIHLEDLPSLLDGHAPFSQRLVCITFDDGFQDFYTAAAPLLAEHGFRATMFLPSGFVKHTRASFKDQPCLTWNEVNELRRLGMRFGSHTVSHPRLHGMPWAQIQQELELSRKALEDQLGERVATFAYPFAYPSADSAFVERFEDLLQRTGYQVNVTTEVGRAQPGCNPLRVPRLPVNSCDDRHLFACKLAGAYDWLERPQRLLKHCKRWLRGSAAPAIPA